MTLDFHKFGWREKNKSYVLGGDMKNDKTKSNLEEVNNRALGYGLFFDNNKFLLRKRKKKTALQSIQDAYKEQKAEKRPPH